MADQDRDLVEPVKMQDGDTAAYCVATDATSRCMHHMTEPLKPAARLRANLGATEIHLCLARAADVSESWRTDGSRRCLRSLVVGNGRFKPRPFTRIDG